MCFLFLCCEHKHHCIPKICKIFVMIYRLLLYTGERKANSEWNHGNSSHGFDILFIFVKGNLDKYKRMIKFKLLLANICS